MEILKSKSIFFSPARKTGEIVSHFVSYLGYDAEKYNITSYKKRDTSVEFSSNDLAVFAYPVYGGRVPDIMVKQLDKMKADNTPAVIIAVYGNRAYEDALLEMQNLAKDKGFIVIAAAAFIATSVLFIHKLGLDLEKAALSMFFLVSIYLLAFLMVSTVPFFSFKKMSYFKARPFQALIIMVIFISILVLYFEVVSFIMITAYITIGLLLALFKMIKGKPKTAEENNQQEN